MSIHPKVAAPAAPLPVVDLSRFRSGTVDERSLIAATADEAARRIGFLQVVGHGIPTQAEVDLTHAFDGFFGLPMWQKKALRTQLNRGYTPPRSERLAIGAHDADAHDEFEGFSVGRSAEDFPGLGLDEVQYPPNLWPLRPEGFEPAVQAWFGHASRVAREVTSVLAVALGLAPGYFAAYQDHSLDVLRLNNYRVPPVPTPANPSRTGMAAHSDGGIVTVLWADQVPGLQVLGPDEVWSDVAPAPGALLVILGDLLARWTNDRWVAPRHRVLPPTDADGRPVRRRSAAFFHDGNADAVISCLPGCESADHPARYASVTVADHLASRAGLVPAP